MRRMAILILLLLLLPWGCGEEEAPWIMNKQPMGKVTTTNYCTGKITASSKVVKPGDIALSRDLERKYRLKFGDLIYLEDEAAPYVFVDRMPAEWHRHADIYIRYCKDAKEYGVRERRLWFARKD